MGYVISVNELVAAS